jgi:hypothetical protein
MFLFRIGSQQFNVKHKTFYKSNIGSIHSFDQVKLILEKQ